MATHTRLLSFAFPAALIALNAPLAHAAARTLSVESRGTDSADCGTFARPCRTITRAITNANDGDTINVGPGTYGNVNDDLDYEDPGEEGTDHNAPCAICITKQLTIRSLFGAEFTIINGNHANPDFQDEIPPTVILVSVLANNVRFGEKDHGFTLQSSVVGVSAGGQANTQIAGNIAQQFLWGFQVERGTGSLLLDSNVALGNLHSFAVGDTPYAILSRNQATANNFGFQVSGHHSQVRANTAWNNSDEGFSVSGFGVQVLQNLSLDNGYGILAYGDHIALADNRVTGSGYLGVLVKGADIRVQRNDIFETRTQIGPIPPGPANCGLMNAGTSPVLATNNYWGAATGPGPDPADDVSNASCKGNAGAIIYKPFATEPFSARIAGRRDAE